MSTRTPTVHRRLTAHLLLLLTALAAARAGELATATSGAPGNANQLVFQLTDDPITYFDGWNVMDGFEAKIGTIAENHIGYVDLQHNGVAGTYGLAEPKQWRFFKTQAIQSTWTEDPGTATEYIETIKGSLTLSTLQDDTHYDTITSGGSETTRSVMWRDDPGSPYYHLKSDEQSTGGFTMMWSVPSWTETVSSTSDAPDGRNNYTATLTVSADPFANATWQRAAYWGAGYPIVGPLPPPDTPFGAPPSQWTADTASWSRTKPNGTGGTYTFKYTISLSNEDTAADEQGRIDADTPLVELKQVPWGWHYYGYRGKLALQVPTDTDRLYLQNHNRLDTDGGVVEEQAAVRFNVPLELQLPSVAYRARVIATYYPYTSQTPPQVVGIYDVTMHDGAWTSPAITIQPPAGDGTTVVQHFTAVAEEVAPHQVLALAGLAVGATPAAPAEYATTKPTLVTQPQITDTNGVARLSRRVLTGSQTLQQINLADDWSALPGLSGATANWSLVPGSTGQVRLWRWHDDGSALGQWFPVTPQDNLVPYYGSNTDFLFVEALSGGKSTVRITLTVAGQSVYDDIAIIAQGVQASLAVDANRDGTIDLPPTDGSAYADQTTTDKPYRFWINDDDDAHGSDTSGKDIPGAASPDYQSEVLPGYNTVKGNRDLVDWFPVVLDLKELLTTLPPSASVKYKLKQADGALNFVFTNLTRDTALTYQRPPSGTPPLSTGFGPALTQAPGIAMKEQITAEGIDLFDPTTGSPAFLDALQNHNGGVLLMEGRAATTTPLVLSVEVNGTVVAQLDLYVSINGVESMFRHLDLRSGADAPADATLVGDLSARDKDPGNPTNLPINPPNFPDTSDTQPWFIFVVGSNVGGQDARGWEAETFKRLYWSLNKSRFLGVSWFGNPYAASTDLIYDYHMAVRNAFATAGKLAQHVNALSGPKTIAAHSLGCCLVAAALTDDDMSVTHTCFLDAAIPREAFDGAAAESETTASGLTAAVSMTPMIWRGYDTRFYAANWNERFDGFTPADPRFTNLTWRDRFAAAVGTVYNFYSSTEDVLGSYDGDVPDYTLGVLINSSGNLASYVWVYQEKAKGNRHDYLGTFHVGSTYGGWGMNLKDPVLSNDPIYWKWDNYLGRLIKAPAEIGSVTDAVLRRDPVFEPGWGQAGGDQQESPVSVIDPVAHAPSWIYDLYGTKGGGLATDYGNRAQLLAEFVPALSLPVGSRALSAATVPSARQHDCPFDFASSAWPRGVDPTTHIARWRHSDMRDVAYEYQWALWDALVSLTQQ